MKFVDFLLEMQAENALPITWQENMSGGWTGTFSIQEKLFQIQLQQETGEMILGYHEIDLPSLHGLIVYRLDYHQVVENRPVHVNTNNLGAKAGQVIGTVAHGVGKLLLDHRYDVLYFMAKPHPDQSRNQRLTMYPALANRISKQYSGIAHSYKLKTGDVLTFLLNYEGAKRFHELERDIAPYVNFPGKS